MADITIHLMPEVSNPSQLKPSFLLLNAFSQINALIHMLTAAQLPLHGLSCETFIKVWDGEHCLTMKLFNLRNALGPNCTSPFLVLGQGGEWEIKNSLSCGSGQIKTQNGNCFSIRWCWLIRVFPVLDDLADVHDRIARPSFIPAKSLWPSLIPAISPCSQSQGRKPNSFQFPRVINSGKDFPVGRIVVRKHSPPVTFPANFSGDVFFPHRKERLEEISNFSQSTGARKPPTRRPRAFFQPATASHAPAREPLSGDALPPLASPDAD
ncbi:hypothetical protein CK203_032379 [Vitis vinifera]|uniref:Uncharacterized protein n=1 Tax=Vitis vinifera TaxID=29760 RepID=A0A438IJX0_VITVI|nr:hypothetical protein CK203_032379 [Vitis vinifera]